jgi:hypothetical protein
MSGNIISLLGSLYKEGEHQMDTAAPQTKRNRAKNEDIAHRLEFLRSLKANDPDLQNDQMTTQLAAHFKIKEATAYQFVRKHYPPSAPSIEALSKEEETLQARLLELQTQKQQILEAKTLKIESTDSGVVLKKEGVTLALTFSEVQTLVKHPSVKIAAKVTMP